jgi:hypothetical protein
MRTPHNPTISMLLLGVLMLLSVACSRRPSDDTIAKDIQNKVATDPATKDSQVNVVAKDGKVTLSGAVSDPTAQQKVEQIAREEPGVAGVENQTTVGSEPAMAAAPPPSEEKPEPQPIVVPAKRFLSFAQQRHWVRKPASPDRHSVRLWHNLSLSKEELFYLEDPKSAGQ